MGRTVAIVAVVTGLAVAPGVTRAEPVELGGETWQHTQPRGAEQFVRADGTAILMTRGQGACVVDHAVTLPERLNPTLEAVPASYWATPFVSDTLEVLCIDLREDYLTVLLTPRDARSRPGVEVALAELRRTAVAAYGAPLATDAGAVVLPRTQQTVTMPADQVAWKVVDGQRLDVAGDVLLSTASLTKAPRYAIGVSESGCSPGATALDPGVAARLFPSGLGTAWVDDRTWAARWRAHVCLEHDGVSATLSVIGPVGPLEPPDDDDVPALRVLLGHVAASYGVEVSEEAVAAPAGVQDTVPSGGGSSSSTSSYRRPFPGQALFYLGGITLAPTGSDRGYGALIGSHLRLAKVDGHVAFAGDAELGYGDGEVIGELRAGFGIKVGGDRIVLDAIVGASAGSTGPAAALDGYVEASLTGRGDRNLFWLGAMRTVGVGGPDHTRFEARFGPAMRGSLAFVGVRYLRFGVDGETKQRTGSGLLVTVGGGLGGR